MSISGSNDSTKIMRGPSVAYMNPTVPADGAVLALTAGAQPTGAFNIATGEPRTVLELAQHLAAGIGAAEEPSVTGRWRLGDVRHVFASPRRAHEILGFRARVSFGEGIARFASVSR